jgi:D-alanyl-D-alanine carboxypeptidase
VPEPVQFAEMLLVESLRARGISARVDLLTRTDEGALAAFYRPENRVAELVSPPLSDEVKPMLKLSSNPQTLHFPYLVGAIAGHEKQNARQAGQEIRQKLFEKAGVVRGFKLGGELGMDRYSADAFITFLTYMSQQPWFAQYLHALPILGKDGTVAKLQAGTPAAGHIYAKTGTGIWMNEPSDRGEVTNAAPSKRGELTKAAPSNRGNVTMAAPSKRGEMTQVGPAGGLRLTFKGKPPQNGANLVKALAGYLELPDGRYIVFTEFLEMEGVRGLKGFDRFDQVMGEIASAVYESLASR